MNEPALAIESVWDYPRPPRLEPALPRIRIFHRGLALADTTWSGGGVLRILETSHPPVYYLPSAAIHMQLLEPSGARRTFCEFKGLATYWSLSDAGRESPSVAWSYESPTPAYDEVKSHLAFYANRLDECWVGEERVVPQPWDFYWGWIT